MQVRDEIVGRFRIQMTMESDKTLAIVQLERYERTSIAHAELFVFRTAGDAHLSPWEIQTFRRAAIRHAVRSNFKRKLRKFQIPTANIWECPQIFQNHSAARRPIPKLHASRGMADGCRLVAKRTIWKLARVRLAAYPQLEFVGRLLLRRAVFGDEQVSE